MIDDDARTLLGRIADALERRQLNRNREALLRISELMHSQTSTSQLAETLVTELRDVLPFDQVFLGTTKSDEHRIECLLHHDHAGNETVELQLPGDAGVCGEALRRGQPIWDNFSDHRATSYYSSEAEREYYRAHGESVMVAPLISDLEVIGLLFIGRTGHQRFTAADFETFMLFCGLGLHAPVPDETTHCRFRNALVKGGVYDDLLGEVCRQLEDHGLKLKAAEAAIVDATLVESAARPRSHIDPPQDRAEGDAPDAPDMHVSADPDARWVKKGSKSTLG
jgi:hypothetical protein